MSSGRNKRDPENARCNINVVQLEGLALLKIIKHCHEEGAGNTEVAQGVLLGLVVDERLEITNCFPFPRHADDVDEGSEGKQFLDLGTMSTLDRQLRCLMENVDDLSQEANKFNNFQRQNAKQLQDKHKFMQKRAAENAQRQARGEPALPEEDINKQFKPIAPLPRLDAMITSGQIYNYCKQVSQFCSQSLGKLYVAKALQQEKK